MNADDHDDSVMTIQTTLVINTRFKLFILLPLYFTNLQL